MQVAAHTHTHTQTHTVPRVVDVLGTHVLRALTALAGEVSRRLHRLSEDRGEIDALTPAHECAPVRDQCCAGYRE